MCCFTKGCTAAWVTPQHDVARHVDLLVGVVPIVNLEWIQKLIRDTSRARPLPRGGDGFRCPLNG
ncbi:phosphoribulokinase [Citrobacter koseri]|uniref:Phosphoribulokinase n=1 Tax=Citrobacter koseri TaxID=545 RepID=A0A2X2W889_CITKO|nr:phosphoribulokinase [Citrobacter koseri]